MSLTAVDLAYAHPGGPRVLQGVSLTLEPGEVMGLGGPSGVGKSSLARILAGHLRPDAGKVTADAAALHAPRQARCVQYAPQAAELATDPRWTVSRILSNGDAPSDETLDALGIRSGWLNRHPAELSGGELQRVSLARLLGPRTRYLICDEITAQLDALSQQSLWSGLLAIAKARALGLLIISHDHGLRRRLTGQNLILLSGRLAPDPA